MDTLPGTQLTDMWMANPWMFDPSQQSNKFSNYNNAALPYPPTYNPGLAGGPVNAATGQPIQSFLDWQKANPGGTTLNATPAAPAPAPAPQPAGLTRAQAWQIAQGMGGTGVQGGGRGTTNPQGALDIYSQLMAGQPQAPSPAAGMQGAGGGAAQGGAAPNNWMAALNALAQPGPVRTLGAQIPAGGAQPGWGFQPGPGMNAAFLQNPGNQFGAMLPQGGGALVGGGAPNQAFLAALGRIQNRPQP